LDLEFNKEQQIDSTNHNIDYINKSKVRN